MMYTRAELLSWRHSDVSKIRRSVRKIVFALCLWLPWSDRELTAEYDSNASGPVEVITRSRGSGNSCSKPDGPCLWQGLNLGVASHRNRLTGVDQQRSERLHTR